MKHVRESLKEFNDYKFFSLFEEEKEEKAGTDKKTLQSKEQDGLSIIDKITKNFEDFKKDSKGEILRFKEFWEENQQNKKQFTEPGDVYKLFNSDYVVGVLELPVKTLSDGSVEGGLGATDEPEEEIIEGKEIQPKPIEETTMPPVSLPTTVSEAEEGEDLDLDLNLGDETGETPIEQPTEQPAEETPIEEPAGSPVEDPMNEPEEPQKDLTAPGTYLVVYDMAGGEREEIFRCGSNNVVKAFNAFYNDIFKGSMKNAIADYKQQKEQEKVEAEKSEKARKETEKQSKVKKFLSEAIEDDEDFDKLNEPDDYDDVEDELNKDGWDEWLDEVENILVEDYDLDDQEVEVFSQIADDQLNSLFNGGASPFDAAGIVGNDEDLWEEFHTSKEEEEFDEEDEFNKDIENEDEE